MSDTLLTITVKLVIPDDTPPKLRQEAYDLLFGYFAGNVEAMVEDALEELTAGCEFTPDEPIASLFDHGSLKIDADAQ